MTGAFETWIKEVRYHAHDRGDHAIQRHCEAIDRLRKIEEAASDVLERWHAIGEDAKDDVHAADDRLPYLIDVLAAVVGGLV